ncbi:helix-turn-helix transcriptional regulator [Bacillus sp. JCM 19034]|uniref:helix-turn-helix transcriptional regulator n=1 Tax=Bacillus sp. JCM 19034 TaxID=1481928 RepID=UPI0007855EE0|nr:helix-turn-helix domain-containing protein [Bacillus sp. JCM 19034]
MHIVLEEQFYSQGHCPIIFSDQYTFSENDSEYYHYDELKLIRMLKAGNIEEALVEIEYLLNRMKEQRLIPGLVKSYFTHLYLSIVKRNVSFSSKDRIEAMVSIENIKAIHEFIPLFKDLFTRFYLVNSKEKSKTYSEVVEKMLVIVDENLGNPNLTLQLVAKQLYMNVDYLGKRFKREMNVKFSTYVTNKRIEKAVEMIEEENDIRVFELAERLGYGDNPQYFSQLFKKITGLTPSDIMKYS